MKAFKDIENYLKAWTHLRRVPAWMVIAYVAECLVFDLMNRREA